MQSITSAPGQILIGTAAWSDLNDFYPSGVRGTDRITYYARQFNVVEVNASFYALLPPENYARWVAITPDDFTFNVKAPGQLTGHDRNQTSTQGLFSAFRESIAALRVSGKLGAVLFQFPPWFDNTSANRNQIRFCVEQMQGDHLLVEFRNRSWLTGESRDQTLAMVSALGASIVTVDAPQIGTGTVPLVPAVTNPVLGYLRLHGRNTESWYSNVENTGQRFNYKYNGDELEQLAGIARDLSREATTVHVIFNNNMASYGIDNARSLMRILGLQAPDEPHRQTRMDI
jgi:uncharacterized protein YecE (DUF72 family)